MLVNDGAVMLVCNVGFWTLWSCELMVRFLRFEVCGFCCELAVEVSGNCEVMGT